MPHYVTYKLCGLTYGNNAIPVFIKYRRNQRWLPKENHQIFLTEASSVKLETKYNGTSSLKRIQYAIDIRSYRPDYTQTPTLGHNLM
jgi:hypothetical protein